MQDSSTRREFLKLAAITAATAAATPTFAAGKPAVDPHSEVGVRLTSGLKRLAAEPALSWQKVRGKADILLDAAQSYQEILGFGGAFTDASCFTFNRLEADAREALFHELFDPAEMNCNFGRCCVGSSDYSTKVYSYDEGEPDPELKRFSIEQDRQWLLPMLRQARRHNPDLFLLSSPWSPPGWMKLTKSMLGGCMRRSNYAVYAQYLLKYLQAYAAEGVQINSITSQNEVDTDQDGHMPQCMWAQEDEINFVGKHLGPLLEKNNMPTKIWLLDHNYDLWGRVLDELENSDVRKYAEGVAWHGYAGKPDAASRVHDAYPDKSAYYTEGNTGYTDPAYPTNWSYWAADFAGSLRNWVRGISVWNWALDEHGKPNVGQFDCGGVLTIHSQTREITRSGLYYAIAHYSRAIRRGARRIASIGEMEKIAHVAFINPDGGYAVVLTNQGAERRVTMQLAHRMLEVALPKDSVTTLSWS